MDEYTTEHIAAIVEQLAHNPPTPRNMNTWLLLAIVEHLQADTAYARARDARYEACDAAWKDEIRAQHHAAMEANERRHQENEAAWRDIEERKLALQEQEMAVLRGNDTALMDMYERVVRSQVERMFAPTPLSAREEGDTNGPSA